MQKPVPEELIAFSEQSLLNLALNGCKVIDPKGNDITESLKSQTPRINADYERALKKYRNRTTKPSNQIKPPRNRPPAGAVTAKPGPAKAKTT